MELALGKEHPDIPKMIPTSKANFLQDLKLPAGMLPMKAAAIAQMVGSEITDISVSTDGMLAVQSSDKTRLSVCGVSDSPEHSWSVERRDDEFHLTMLIVVCESDGKLFGATPKTLAP
jgi:hypothetical protein